MAELVASPNAPRPTGMTRSIADMLARIEKNYLAEGSGPGSRFEGRLLEDVQAASAIHAITARLRNELRLWYSQPARYTAEDLMRVIVSIEEGSGRE